MCVSVFVWLCDRVRKREVGGWRKRVREVH